MLLGGHSVPGAMPGPGYVMENRMCTCVSSVELGSGQGENNK